jgi:hypothetical protein
VRFARMIIVAAAVPLLLAPVAAEAAGVFDNLVLSPRVRALGGAFVALSDDEMALFTNPAGLADQGKVMVYASYVDLFGYDFLDLGSIAAVVPTTYGTFGAGGRILKAEYQGVDLERELSFSVGHGIMLMKDIHSSLAIGYSANLYGLSFEAESVAGEDLGSASTVGFDVGVLGTLRGRTRFRSSATLTPRICPSGSRPAWRTAPTAGFRRFSSSRSRTTRTCGRASASRPGSPTT